MRVLVIYIQTSNRKTISDSMYCFSAYQKKYEVYYYKYNQDFNILPIIKHIHFDMVIYHNTFLCLLWNKEQRNDVFKRFSGLWKNSVKAVMPQDEYVYTDAIVEFVKKTDSDIIFTLANHETSSKFYPKEKAGNCKIVRVLTGYVDEKTVAAIAEMESKKSYKKDIDIGYRANRVNYSLGKLGALKSLITIEFNQYLKKEPMLNCDIKNTFGEKNLFKGMDWFYFLLRCRTMVNCPGGASVYDPQGILYTALYRYNSQPFSKEIYRKLETGFKDKYDTKLDYEGVSPRHFECIMTKTCQLLIEGDLCGIMQPGIHYIEVKRDFSNLPEVIAKVKDQEYCKQIAEQAYKDIILSKKYTYEKYVKKVFRIMEAQLKCNKLEISHNAGLKGLFWLNDKVIKAIEAIRSDHQ